MISRKFKKIISAIMLMVIMVTTFPVNVFANPSEFEGSCGGNIMYSFNEYTGELVIQGQGKMQDFSSLNPSPWYSSYKNRITSIKIEDGITYIGKCVFMDCRGLTSITIPNSVIEIGRMAFAGCTGLKSVILGNSVEKISDLAFWECTNLTSLTYLGKSDLSCSDAFDENSPLKEVNVPFDYEGDTFCGIKVKKEHDTLSQTSEDDECGENVKYAFDSETGALTIYEYGCCRNYPWEKYKDEIKSVKIEDGVDEICRMAFEGYTSLISVTIPDSVMYIWSLTFEGCTSLTSVTIPNSVTEIGEGAFSGCTSLESITIDNGLTSIGEYAFDGCTSLTSVTIPNSVTEIGDRAFFGCTSLESVIIGNGLTSISECAFDGCTSLTPIIVPNSGTIENQEAMEFFENLFEGSRDLLVSVTIGSDVTEITDKAFRNCISLASINVDEKNTNYQSIDGVLFSKDGTKLLRYPPKKEITNYIIPNSVTDIGKHAFRNCEGLISVTIGENVTSIGMAAFKGCKKLSSVIYRGVTEPDYTPGGFEEEDSNEKKVGLIESLLMHSDSWVRPTYFGEDCTFEDCCKLREVSVPINYKGKHFCQKYIIRDKSATSDKLEGRCGKNVRYEFNVPTGELVIIGEGEMDNYSYYPEVSSVTPWESYKDAIESVTIKYGVNNIGDGAFYDCKNLTYVKMAPVLSVGKFAFSGCGSLTSINIPKGVKSIGESAFWGCKRLSSVTIPDSINFIDHHAFSCCASLDSVTYYGKTQPQIGRFMLKHPVFKDCSQLKEVKVTSNYKGNHFCGKKVFK